MLHFGLWKHATKGDKKFNLDFPYKKGHPFCSHYQANHIKDDSKCQTGLPLEIGYRRRHLPHPSAYTTPEYIEQED